jgi:hypothetical protein
MTEAPSSVHDMARYDIAIDIDVDPTSAAASRAGARCRCRLVAESPPDVRAMTNCVDTGYLAPVSLSVGDCRTTVDAAATGQGSWRLFIRWFPGRFGASAALMALTEQLRHTLGSARLTPTHITASPAVGRTRSAGHHIDPIPDHGRQPASPPQPPPGIAVVASGRRP